MKIDTLGARWIRGLVKTVFIICYVAFMWASIHHLATFFNDFESDRNNTFGSYLLAGAFDITALVTTIGVMFFRKSMPRSIQWIVWTFIVALAGYSFFVNWEYAAHYQNISLALQQTGETTPVYDAQGVLHYVPVMQTNTNLLWINPILASGFTVFSLIYSVIAEFFGTKPPNVSELVAKKKYLEETSELLSEIKTLEDKGKKPSLIQRAKDVVMEVKSAANEVVASGDNAPDIDQEVVTNEPEYEEDIQEDSTPIIEPEQQTYAPLRRDDLGMIEGIMYDKVMENETVLFELLNEANMSSISDLTLSLQRRFSSHANYITESRVRNVFEAIKSDHPQVISAPNEDNMEPDTDPEMETISPSNDIQVEDDNGVPEPANITNISSVKKSRITQDLNPDMQSKRGAYAITKQAAAELLRCPISEIERGIMAGEIKPFAKDIDKVLRSSVEGFAPQKRSRKAAKVASK